MIKEKKTYCVHCGEEMHNAYGNESWAAPYCNHPECGNYKLLQAGI